VAGSRLLWAARRLGVGFLVVGVLKEGSRAALLALLPLLYRFFPLPIRRLWQPPMHNLAKPVAAGPRQRQQQNGAQHDARDGSVRVQRRRQQGKDGGGRGGSAPGAAEHADALPPADPRLAELPHSTQGVPWDVDVTSRFFAYAAIGVAVAGVTPRIFDALRW
jgi:hypothetical protein